MCLKILSLLFEKCFHIIFYWDSDVFLLVSQGMYELKSLGFKSLISIANIFPYLTFVLLSFAYLFIAKQKFKKKFKNVFKPYQSFPLAFLDLNQCEKVFQVPLSLACA